MQQVKNNPQVYNNQEGMQEITQDGIGEIIKNPQVYTTQRGNRRD